MLPLVLPLLIGALAQAPIAQQDYEDAAALYDDLTGAAAHPPPPGPAGDDDDDDSGTCPGLDIVLTCCNLVCEPDLGENEDNCPEDCNDALYWSYNQQTLCPEAVALERPTSAEEVVALVNSARAQGLHVKAIGHRHSATDVICTDGIALDMLGMTRIHGVETYNGETVVHVDAGVYATDLNEYLYAQNYSIGFAWMGYNGVTVGGAVGTGSHGSSMTESALISSFVAALDVVLADGSLVTFDETNTEPDMWRALRASYGYLGVVTSLRLRVQPAFNIRVQVGYGTTEDEFFADPLAVLEGCDYGQANWFPGQAAVMTTCGKREDELPAEDGAQNVLLDPIVPDFTLDPFKLTAQLAACSPDNGITCFLEWSRYIDFVNNPPFVKTGPIGRVTNTDDVVGPVHRLTSSFYVVDRIPETNFHQIDLTAAIPERYMHEALAELRQMFADNEKCLFLIGLFFRFTKIEDATLLAHSAASADPDSAWVNDEFAINIEMPVHIPVGFTGDDEEAHEAPYQEILETLVRKYEARLHPGKCRDRTFDLQREVGTFGSNTDRFDAVRRQLDPTGVFLNDFAQRLF